MRSRRNMTSRFYALIDTIFNYPEKELKREDDSGSVCNHGVEGKRGKINGQRTTRHFITWGLDKEFTCKNEDQVRGFTCDDIAVAYCCAAEPEQNECHVKPAFEAAAAIVASLENEIPEKAEKLYRYER